MGDRVVNQYDGIRDVDLAKKLAEFLQIDVPSLSAQALSRTHLVRLIHEAAEED